MKETVALLPSLDLFDDSRAGAGKSKCEADWSDSVSLLKPDLAQQVYQLVRSGSFGLHRQRLIEIFKEEGGACAGGLPEKVKPVLSLCLEVSALSHMKGRKPFKLWFNYLSGRIELDCFDGKCDSLTIWAQSTRLYCA